METTRLENSEYWYQKWKDETGLEIAFPSGWNSPVSASWEEPITWEEFLARIKESEIGIIIDD